MLGEPRVLEFRLFILVVVFVLAFLVVVVVVIVVVVTAVLVLLLFVPSTVAIALVITIVGGFPCIQFIRTGSLCAARRRSGGARSVLQAGGALIRQALGALLRLCGIIVCFCVAGLWRAFGHVDLKDADNFMVFDDKVARAGAVKRRDLGVGKLFGTGMGMGRLPC
ncbi:hypothetical protein VTK26DRAFT_8717 [Humicola hyalothermophila]